MTYAGEPLSVAFARCPYAVVKSFLDTHWEGWYRVMTPHGYYVNHYGDFLFSKASSKLLATELNRGGTLRDEWEQRCRGGER